MNATCIYDTSILYLASLSHVDREIFNVTLSSTGTVQIQKDFERQNERLTIAPIWDMLSRHASTCHRAWPLLTPRDKSKVWNASGRISVYLWQRAIQWYTFPVARNSQYFHQKHTYNSRLRRHTVAANGALWEFRAHLTARIRRASCCHLFAHYITLLPSRVSPANLHYKCRWCYHCFAYTLWRRWRIINGGLHVCSRSFMYILVHMMLLHVTV